MRDNFVSRYRLITAALVTPLAAAVYPAVSAAGNPAQYTLYSFSPLAKSTATNNDGASPTGEFAIGPDASYYGIAYRGGTNGGGTLFKLDANGNLTNLHNFSGSGSAAQTEGSTPAGDLMMAGDGNIYGTTTSGGANGFGTIYRISTSGVFTTLHSFSANTGVNSDGGDENTDGTDAFSKLVQAGDGNLYGTAEDGGANGYGTIYRISLSGTYSVVYSFNGTTDGGLPFSDLTIGADGKFYGTSYDSVFSVTSSGTFTTLHTFSTTDGRPGGVARGADNNFYGFLNSAPLGGPGTGGSFFRVTPGGVYTALSTLDAPTYAIFNDLTQTVGPNVSGLNIYSALVTGSDGNFYGIANNGGTSAGGTIFRVTPDGTLTNLYSFDNKADSSGKQHAQTPDTSLSFDSSGNLVGGGWGGGANGTGAIYSLKPSSPLTANLSISPSSVAVGKKATVSWTSTGASSCLFVGDATGAAAGTKPASGSFTRGGPLYPKKMVTSIQCEDTVGGLSNSTASLTSD